MRLLHTSDWHLGRSFHRVGMLTAQTRFVDHLVETVRAERVELVVVAGDVYDRALPSVETVSLLDETLVRLRDAGATVVLSSGNHDSRQRLGFGARLLAHGGVHIRTDPTGASEPVLLEDRHGPVAIYPIPYLEPVLAAPALGFDGGRTPTHQGVLAHVMDGVRMDLASRPAGTRSLVAAHAFVVGGLASDSERDISVGGVASVPAGVFAGVDYVALGHLHRPQELAPAVRYSGSPVAYSFSEAGQDKLSWLVELDQSGVTRVDAVPAPVDRELAVLRGHLEDLLSDPAHTRAESAYCQVTLTDATRPRSAMERIRARFPHTLMLSFEPEGAARSITAYAAKVRGRDDLQVCCDFVEHVRGGAGPSEAERALLREALEATGGEVEPVRTAGRTKGAA